MAYSFDGTTTALTNYKIKVNTLGEFKQFTRFAKEENFLNNSNKFKKSFSKKFEKVLSHEENIKQNYNIIEELKKYNFDIDMLEFEYIYNSKNEIEFLQFHLNVNKLQKDIRLHKVSTYNEIETLLKIIIKKINEFLVFEFFGVGEEIKFNDTLIH
jgi:hypothetical protein